jgi:small GTP-binding protein
MVDDIQVKIIILGNTNVGKSCILNRYLTGVFSESQDNTIGAKFMTKRLVVQGKTLKYNIWDTAGQERYQSFSKMYCRDARAVILVYDLTEPSSLPGMINWYKMMSEDTLPDDCLLFIVGNKCDTGKFDQELEASVQDFASGLRADHFLISAKTGEGIEEIFMQIAVKYLKKTKAEKASIVIDKDKHKVPKKSKCC